MFLREGDHLKKKLLLYALVLVLLTAVLSAFIIVKCRKYDFSYLQFGRIIDDEREILVERTRGKTAFLYVKNGKLDRKISFNVVGDNKFYNLDSIWTVGEEVYFSRFYNRLGYIEQNYEVLRLDYENGMIVKLLEITQSDIETIFGKELGFYSLNFSHRDGQLIMTACLYNNEKQVFQYYRCLCQDGAVSDVLETWEGQEGSNRIYDADAGMLGFQTQMGKLVAEDGTILTDRAYRWVYPFDQGHYLARRLTGDGIDLIDPKTKEVVEEGLYVEMQSLGISLTELRDICKYQDRILLTCSNDQETYLAEYQNGEFRRYGQIPFLGKTECIFICIIVLILLLFCQLPFLFLWRTVISRHIIAKILLLIIPALMICDQAAYVSIHKIMRAENKKALEETLTLVAKQYESLGLVQKVEDFHEIVNTESEDYHELATMQYLLYYMPNLHNIIDQSVGIKNDFISSMVFYGYDKEAGTFFELYNGHDYTLERLWEPAFVDVVLGAIKEKKPVYYSYYDMMGQYMRCLIYPVQNENGEINGFFLVDTSEPEVQVYLDLILLQVVKYELLLNISVVLILFLLILGILSPLKALKRKAISLTNGELRLKKFKLKNRRYVNEISYISRHFDQMAQSVQDNLAEIERLRISNHQYFSDHLLETLHKKSIALLNFKESETENYYYIAAELSEKFDSFARYHWFMGKLCTRLDDCHAFVGHLEGRRLLILSPDKLLVSVMYYMHQLDNDIFAVFDHAQMNVAVVGSGKQFRFSSTCTEKHRIEELLQYRETVSAKLVLTQRVLHELDKNVIHNCIGMVDGEYVYEILVGALNSKKKLIADLLQEAVGSFFKKEYEQARFLFVRVLKTDGENETARFYIKQIEEGMGR